MQLDEEAYAEIGRVAVEAAGLEWRVITLLILMRGNEGDEEEMLRESNSRWRKELKKVAASHEDAELGTDVVAWTSRAEDLLEERHRLIHAQWVNVVRGGERIPTAMHRRSRTFTAVADVPILGLADRLKDCWAAGGPFVHRAGVHCGLLQ